MTISNTLIQSMETFIFSRYKPSNSHFYSFLCIVKMTSLIPIHLQHFCTTILFQSFILQLHIIFNIPHHRMFRILFLFPQTKINTTSIFQIMLCCIFLPAGIPQGTGTARSTQHHQTHHFHINSREQIIRLKNNRQYKFLHPLHAL